MKTLWRVLSVLVILGALGGGGFWLYQRYLAPDVSAENQSLSQVVAVQRGSLTATISEVGELYAVQQEDLYFDHAAGTTQLLSLDVGAGQEVSQGQVLATIDPTPYAQVLDQAKSDLQQAEEQLADLQVPPTELEIAQADLAIARARLNLQQAEQDLEDLLEPDVADLEAKVATAELALVEAQRDLHDIEEDEATADRLYQLREQEADSSAEYTRLANETYSDAYYQDRLRKAYDALLEIQATVARTETQAEITLLNAQQRVQQAEQKLADAKQAVVEAQQGPDELTVAEARLKVAQAQVALEEAADRRVELDAPVDAVRLAAAQATVDKRRLAVADAEEALADATLLAPFDGTVLDTGAEWGDLVNQNTLILTVANLDSLQVVTLVDETTIRQAEAGQNATISFDAFPGQTFQGQVLSVPLQGALQGGVMVYEVPVSLSGAERLGLKVGMTANVEIEVGKAEDVLLVPTMALLNVGGFQQVLVPGNDPEAEPQSVPVQAGLSNGVYTEIVRGLNEGDQVLVQLQADDSGFMGGFEMGRMMITGGGGPPGEPGFRRDMD